ncbi:MAG TPA: hypothetical protein VI729_05060 [Anaerolineales bacterium]|nr:hypothetical protein [Anaerolineales bacterium]
MASALDAARVTIESRIKTLWAADENTTIIWPNDPKDPPASGTWIEPAIVWGDGFLSTKDGRQMITGVVSINVFGQAGNGFGPVTQSADSVRDMVNSVEVSGVRFGVPSGPRRIPNPESKWVQANVRVPFSVDETV